MPRLRSLRWRLTITYVGLLAILLCGLAVFEYGMLRGSLINARVETFTGDIDSAKALFNRGAARNLPVTTAAQRFAVTAITVSGRTVAVVVYDTSFKEIAAAPGSTDVPRLDAATLRETTSGHSSPTVAAAPNGGSELSVAYVVNVTTAGKFYVQVSTPMDSIDLVLRRTVGLLAIGSSVALGIALLLGLWLTSRGLRPLGRLTAAAGELAAGDLGARSRLSHGDDEIGTLGSAFDDMAARIEAAFRAQEESEAKARRFIADASHELRTPVTSLKGYIDVMRRGAGRDPESLDAILESMQREADRMRLLVIDLLSLARLDAGQETGLADVDINELIGRILDEGVPDMPASLTRDFATEPVIARADAAAVTTIARNLLVNACKYAPGAPQTWSTRVEDHHVVIRVRDDGPGIPAADLPHLFERFYRGEKTRAREEGGSGLGLSIVQGLAQGMGGDVAIASREGSGTTVTLTLRLAPAVTQPR